MLGDFMNFNYILWILFTSQHERADLVAYSHGAYYALGEKLGTFGFSVRKKTTGKSRKKGGSCHDKR
jgi:hypothetical protein